MKFGTARQNADQYGKTPPLLFYLRQGEKLYFPQSPFRAYVFTGSNEASLAYEISGEQTSIFTMGKRDMDVSFHPLLKKNILWVCLCLLAALLLPPRYSIALSATALLTALEFCLFPKVNPLRSMTVATVLLLSIRNWTEIKCLCTAHIRHPAWHLTSMFTTLVMLRIPIFNLISDAFPAPLPALALYLMLLFPLVFLTFNAGKYCWDKISAAPAESGTADFTRKLTTLLNHRLFCPAAAVFFISYLYANNPLFFSKYKFFCKYRLGHLLYSYELAFMPRALVGTIFCWLSKYFSQVLLLQFFYWVCVAICLGLLIASLRKIRNSQHLVVLSLLAGIYFTVPTTYMHLINDFARLDFFLLAIAVLSLVLIWHDSPLKWLTLLLIPLGTMIHELFLLFYLPAIMAGAVWKSEWKNKKNVIFLAACALASVSSILLFCSIKSNTPKTKELIEFCSAKDRYQVTFFSSYALSIVEKDYFFHICNLGNEIKKNLSAYLTGMLFTLLALAYPCRVWWQLLKTRTSKQRRLKLLFLALAAFAPFSAALIIVDYPRWQAAALHSNFMLLLFLLSDQNYDAEIKPPTEKNIILIGCLMILFLFSGPADWLWFSEICKNISEAVAQSFHPPGF